MKNVCMLAVALSMSLFATPAMAGDWTFTVTSQNDGHQGVLLYKHDSQTMQSEYWVHSGAEGKKTKKEARQEAKAEVDKKNREKQDPVTAEADKDAQEKTTGKEIPSSTSVVASPEQTCVWVPTAPGCQPDNPLGDSSSNPKKVR